MDQKSRSINDFWEKIADEAVEEQKYSKGDGYEDRGFVFHKLLAAIYVIRLYKASETDPNLNFKIGAEVKEAGKFDDLCLTLSKDGLDKSYLVQFKNKKANRSITLEHFITEDDFKLSTYHNSFEAIKNNSTEDSFQKIQNVILFTNIPLDDVMVHEDNVVKDFTEVFDGFKLNILPTSDGIKNPKIYKFLTEGEKSEHFCEKLNTQFLKNIAIDLVNKLGKSVELRVGGAKNLLAQNQFILAKEVINFKTKTFHENFINDINLSKDLASFRAFFKEEIEKKMKKDEKNNVCFKIYAEKLLKDTIFKDKIPGIYFENEPNQIVIKKCVEKAKQHDMKSSQLLCQEVYENLDEKTLNISFENNINAIYDKDFDLNILKNELFDLDLIKKLKKFDPKWPNIKEFLDKLLIAVDQSDNEMLEIIVKNELKNIDNCKDDILFVELFISCIYSWLKFKKGIYIDKTTVKKILKFCENSWQNIHFLIDKQKYEKNHQATFVINFQINTLNEKIIQGFEKSKVLYIIAPASVEVTTMRAYRMLKQQNMDFIVANSSDFKLTENMDYIKIALESRKDGVLLIDYDDANYSYILYFFKAYRIIFVLSKENAAKKVEKNELISDYFDFDHLDQNSKLLLLKKELVLQSKEKIQIKDLVEQNANKFLNEQVISYLLLNENINLEYQKEMCDEKKFFVIVDRKIYKNCLSLNEEINICDSKIKLVKNNEKFRQTKLDNNVDLVLLVKDISDDVICTNFKGQIYLIEKMIRRLIRENVNLKEIKEKIIILRNEAGVGKSTYLLTNRQELLKTHIDHIVIHLSLKDHTDILSKYKQENWKETIINDILKLDNILAKEYMSFCLSESGRIVFLFDCFDEISEICQVKALELMKKIKHCGGKIFVVSRSSSNLSLENELQTLSYSLSDLSLDEQKKFLLNLISFNNEITQQQENAFKANLSKLLKIMKKDLTREFFANPLQLKMIFKVFEKDFKKNDIDKLQKMLQKRIEISEVYKSFIDEKFVENLKRSKINTQIIGQKVISKAYKILSIDMHKKLAGHLLFDFEAIEDSKFLENTAIVTENHGQYEFIHKTFAEYFGALLLIEELNFNRLDNGKLVNLLFNHTFVYLRKFWNYLLMKEKKCLKTYVPRELTYNFEALTEIVIEEKTFYLLNFIVQFSLLHFETRDRAKAIFDTMVEINDCVLLDEYLKSLQKAIEKSVEKLYCNVESFKEKLFDYISRYQHKLFHNSSFEKDKILFKFISKFGRSEQFVEILFKKKWYDTLIQVLIRSNKKESFSYIFKNYTNDLSKTGLQIIDQNLYKSLITSVECKDHFYLNTLIEAFKPNCDVDFGKNLLSKKGTKGIICFNYVFITSNEENMKILLNVTREIIIENNIFEVIIGIWNNFEHIFQYTFKSYPLIVELLTFLNVYEKQVHVKRFLSEEIVYRNTIKFGNEQIIALYLRWMEENYIEIYKNHIKCEILPKMNLKTFCQYFEKNIINIDGEIDEHLRLSSDESKNLLFHHIILTINEKNVDKFKLLLFKSLISRDQLTINIKNQIIQSNRNETDDKSFSYVFLNFLKENDAENNYFIWDTPMVIDCFIKTGKKGLKMLENYIITQQNQVEYNTFLEIFVKAIDEDYNYRTLFLFNRNNSNIHQIWLHHLLYQLLSRKMYESVLVGLKLLENFRRYWRDSLKIKFMQYDKKFNYFEHLKSVKFDENNVKYFLSMLKFLIKYIEYIPTHLVNAKHVLIDNITSNILDQSFNHIQKMSTECNVRTLLNEFYSDTIVKIFILNSTYQKFESLFKAL